MSSDSIHDSIFENEHWIMAICPRWRRKKYEKVRIKCTICDGTGSIPENQEDLFGFFCKYKPCSCKNGFEEVLPKIPPPPVFDQQFLNDLKEFFESYPKKGKLK